MITIPMHPVIIIFFLISKVKICTFSFNSIFMFIPMLKHTYTGDQFLQLVEVIRSCVSFTVYTSEALFQTDKRFLFLDIHKHIHNI